MAHPDNHTKSGADVSIPDEGTSALGREHEGMVLDAVRTLKRKPTVDLH